MITTDVIIPARNEAVTVGKVVEAFMQAPGIGHVFVSVDGDTDDRTADNAILAGAVLVDSGNLGKGQVISAALPFIYTERVILCDADLTGLTPDHVVQLLGEGHIIGVADFPLNEILASKAVRDNPGWFKRIMETWPFVSGVRSLPVDILWHIELHGYLVETQINNTCIRAGIEFTTRYLRGLHSPFMMTDKRLAEMERDRLWAAKKGLFGDLCNAWESCNRGITSLWNDA